MYGMTQVLLTDNLANPLGWLEIVQEDFLFLLICLIVQLIIFFGNIPSNFIKQYIHSLVVNRK